MILFKKFECKLINEFVTYLFVVRNFSNTYIKNIITTLKQFMFFVNSYKYNAKGKLKFELLYNNLNLINTSDIYCFLFYLAENNCHSNTRNTRLVHLRVFFRYLEKIGKIHTNPTESIRFEKRIKSFSHYLSFEDIELFIKYIKFKESKR